MEPPARRPGAAPRHDRGYNPDRGPTMSRASKERTSAFSLLAHVSLSLRLPRIAIMLDTCSAPCAAVPSTTKEKQCWDPWRRCHKYRMRLPTASRNISTMDRLRMLARPQTGLLYARAGSKRSKTRSCKTARLDLIEQNMCVAQRKD